MNKLIKIGWILPLLLIISHPIQSSAQSSKQLFVEMAFGGETDYIGKIEHPNSITVVDKRYTTLRFSPSVGIRFNDKWALGFRASLSTHPSVLLYQYNIYSLYAQRTLFSKGRFDLMMEGKFSYFKQQNHYYHNFSNHEDLGVSLMGNLNIDKHFSLVLHYLYAGFIFGDIHFIEYRPGCIGKGHYILDFSFSRLALGVRYTI